MENAPLAMLAVCLAWGGVTLAPLIMSTLYYRTSGKTSEPSWLKLS